MTNAIPQQSITMNVHHPRVQDASVLDSGTVTIDLSSGSLNGTIIMFFHGGVAAVESFIADLQVAVAGIEK